MNRRETNREIQLRLGKNLRRMRKLKGMTQLEMAGWLEMDKEAVEKLESGVRPLMTSHLLPIANAFDMDLHQVMTNLDEKT